MGVQKGRGWVMCDVWWGMAEAEDDAYSNCVVWILYLYLCVCVCTFFFATLFAYSNKPMGSSCIRTIMIVPSMGQRGMEMGLDNAIVLYSLYCIVHMYSTYAFVASS